MVNASGAQGDVFHNVAETLMVNTRFNPGLRGQVFKSSKYNVFTQAATQNMCIS
jgi:hypothetical protein